MNTLKYKKIYLLINVPLMVIALVLLFSPIFIADKGIEYYIGIIARIIFGIWFVFNGIWDFSTDYYSILKNNSSKMNKTALRWSCVLIILLGIGFIVTAFMGYGFNNLQKPMGAVG